MLNRQVFSIRKTKLGVGSVLLATLFCLSGISASAQEGVEESVDATLVEVVESVEDVVVEEPVHEPAQEPITLAEGESTVESEVITSSSDHSHSHESSESHRGVEAESGVVSNQEVTNRLSDLPKSDEVVYRDSHIPYEMDYFQPHGMNRVVVNPSDIYRPIKFFEKDEVAPNPVYLDKMGPGVKYTLPDGRTFYLSGRELDPANQEIVELVSKGGTIEKFYEESIILNYNILFAGVTGSHVGGTLDDPYKVFGERYKIRPDEVAEVKAAKMRVDRALEELRKINPNHAALNFGKSTDEMYGAFSRIYDGYYNKDYQPALTIDSDAQGDVGGEKAKIEEFWKALPQPIRQLFVDNWVLGTKAIADVNKPLTMGDARDTRDIRLWSSYPEWAKETLGHEGGHLLDFMSAVRDDSGVIAKTFSRLPDWQQVWKDGFSNSRSYFKDSAQEAFAEGFGRYLFVKYLGESKDKMEADHPTVYNYFDALVERVFGANSEAVQNGGGELNEKLGHLVLSFEDVDTSESFDTSFKVNDSVTLETSSGKLTVVRYQPIGVPYDLTKYVPKELQDTQGRPYVLADDGGALVGVTTEYVNETDGIYTVKYKKDVKDKVEETNTKSGSVIVRFVDEKGQDIQKPLTVVDSEWVSKEVVTSKVWGTDVLSSDSKTELSGFSYDVSQNDRVKPTLTGTDGKEYELVGLSSGDEKGVLKEGNHEVVYTYRLAEVPTPPLEEDLSNEEMTTDEVVKPEVPKEEVPTVEDPKEELVGPEKGTDESTKPTDESTKPTDESTKPTDESTKPTDESTKPTDESTKPTDESTKTDISKAVPANPSEKVQPMQVAVSGELPRTGDSNGMLLGIGALSFLAGAGLSLIRRKDGK